MATTKAIPTVTVEVLEVKGLRTSAGKEASSPYVYLRVGQQKKRSTTLSQTSHSWKGEVFTFDLSSKFDQQVTIELYNDVRAWTDEKLGSAAVGIPSEPGERPPQWVKLEGQQGAEVQFVLKVDRPSADFVGVVQPPKPTEDLGYLESFFQDWKTLGTEGTSQTISLMVKSALESGEPMDDRKGALDLLIHTFSRLPANSELLKTLEPKLIQKLWDDIEKPPRVLAGDYYRSADGGRNSLRHPWVGQAGTHYTRTVNETRPHVPVLPDPGDVFDLILDRNNQKGDKKFIPHPNGLSVVLFYLATLITHDLFYSDPKDPTINTTTHYADLSPLYGRNQREQDGVREKRDGLLKPDAFSEIRLALQPQGVAALLVLFSRNHNYIARKLKELNEGGRFSTISPVGRHFTEEEIDEKLFQTARNINVGCYVNLILHDYLHSILGFDASTFWVLNPGTIPPAANSTQGNQLAIEFNFAYRWHSTIGNADTQWADQLITEYKQIAKENNDFSKREKPLSYLDILKKLLGATEEEWKRGTPVRGLKRQPDGYFNTKELGKIWQEAIEQVAGKPGANHTPTSFKFLEEGAIIQGRLAGACSLNSLRKYLKLKPHETFRDINPDPAVYEALAQLYEHPDDVELYPGAQAEQAKPYGTALQYTISRAILSDATNLIRNDRFLMEDFTPENLTSWGFRFARGDPNVNGGSIMHNLMLLHLPGYFPPDSPYVWDSMHVPQPGTLKPNLWVNPRASAIPVVDFASVKAVFENDKAFNLPYKTKIEQVSGGYGNLLSFTDTPQYRRDAHNIVSIATTDFAPVFKWAVATSEQALQEFSTKLRDNKRKIDVVHDLAKYVALSYLEEAWGIPFSKKPSDGFMERYKLADTLDSVFHFGFDDADPAETVVIAKYAISASHDLENYILDLIKLLKTRPEKIKGDHLLRKFLGLQAKSKNVEADGLTDEIITHLVAMLAVGSYTKIYRTTSLFLEYLIKNPTTLEKISKETDQKVLEKYVLEGIRLVNPAPLIYRVVAQDAKVSSKGKEVAVKPGQIVVLDINAAHSDPAVFPNPQEFRIDRDPQNYLEFGHGLHRCYGRNHALAVISGIIRAITSKKDLAICKHHGLGISYLTYDAALSPFPQHLLINYYI